MMEEKLVEMELYRYNTVLFGKVLKAPEFLRTRRTISSYRGRVVQVGLPNTSSSGFSDTVYNPLGTDPGRDHEEFVLPCGTESAAREAMEMLIYITEKINKGELR